MNITLIDYGTGNIKSIQNAFKESGVNLKLSREKEVIYGSEGIILPGVGAFAHGMKNLIKYDLIDVIKETVEKGKPLLGICLGMQLMFEESEEFGITKGLGLFKGRVIKVPIKQSKKVKLPHISWNEIKKKKTSWNGTILDNLTNGSDMYFIHTFVAKPDIEDEVLSETEYAGVKFCSSVKKNNIYGCQFHPKKSSEAGLKVIKNFVKICKENKQ